ncbi:hypothetical protein AAGW38_07040 [Staphylococcus aureus]
MKSLGNGDDWLQNAKSTDNKIKIRHCLTQVDVFKDLYREKL